MKLFPIKLSFLKRPRLPAVDCAFVLGCSHSGTSIMLRLLSEHTDVYAIPKETSIFVKGLSDQRIKKEMAEFDRLTRTAGKKLWIEKTPKHLEAISKILRLRPQAKIIGMMRDPRDVACSLKGRGYSFKYGLDFWLRMNGYYLNYLNQQNLILIRLEELVRSPKPILLKILQFLDLPEENLLNYHKHPLSWYADRIITDRPDDETEEHHVQLRNWQINQPLFNSTVRYLKDMNSDDKKIYRQYENKVISLLTKFQFKLLSSESNP